LFYAASKPFRILVCLAKDNKKHYCGFFSNKKNQEMKFGFGDAILIVVIVTFIAKFELVDSKTIPSKSKSLMEELEDDDDEQRNILENQNWIGLYFNELNYDYLPLAVIFTVCNIIK
jgi:hypothetical protein